MIVRARGAQFCTNARLPRNGFSSNRRWAEFPTHTMGNSAQSVGAADDSWPNRSVGPARDGDVPLSVSSVLEKADGRFPTGTSRAPRASRPPLASVRARQRPYVCPPRDRGAGGPGRGRRGARRAAQLLAGRATRSGGQGVARAGALGPRQLGLQVPDEPDHGKPGARRPAQGRPELRPGDCGRAPGGLGPASPGAALRGRPRGRAGARWLGPACARSTGDGGGGPGAGRRGDRGTRAERAGGSPCRRAEGRAAGPARAARASGHRGRATDSLAADLERERLRGCGAGPRGPARTAVPSVRARGGGRRRSQPADRRSARRRQVARRAPPAVDHAPARPLRGDGGAAGSRAPAAGPRARRLARRDRSGLPTTRSRPQAWSAAARRRGPER